MTIRAPEERIAELEREIEMRTRQRKYDEEAKERLEGRIKELEAKLVERDVYEAEQRLPPEQAALIKHLAGPASPSTAHEPRRRATCACTRVAPGRVYLLQNLAPYLNPTEVTRVAMPDADEVATTDDEDVP